MAGNLGDSYLNFVRFVQSGAATTDMNSREMTPALRSAIEATFVPHVFKHVDVDALFRSIGELENGHAEQAGWHFGWRWRPDGSGLDFLSEHRMSDIEAIEFRIDEAGRVTTDYLDTPSSFRRASEDPVEDARLAAAQEEENRRIYADLRARGLLPELGENLLSQDTNEVLSSGLDGD